MSKHELARLLKAHMLLSAPHMPDPATMIDGQECPVCEARTILWSILNDNPDETPVAHVGPRVVRSPEAVPDLP